MSFLVADRNFLAAGGTLSKSLDDYPEGLLLPVDKPYRWTSADVIRKLKYAACRHFGRKKLKVGHAGTLDPLATGVLLVCIGPATRQAETLQRHDKEYLAGIAFGATTPSYDLEKEIDRNFPTDKVSEENLRSVLQGFIGPQEQLAPLFSAKSVDGVRAYELARKRYKAALRSAAGPAPEFDGKDLLSVQRIEIFEAELLRFLPAGLPAPRQECGAAPVPKDRAALSGIKESDRLHAADQEPTAGVMENGLPKTAAPTDRIGSRSGADRIHVCGHSGLRLPHADIRISCTKGTYIRAFARDLGEALDSGAHLDALRRTRSGDFNVSEALRLEEALSLLQA